MHKLVLTIIVVCLLSGCVLESPMATFMKYPEVRQAVVRQIDTSRTSVSGSVTTDEPGMSFVVGQIFSARAVGVHANGQFFGMSDTVHPTTQSMEILK